uniref:Uncharacterized protein n=1 Tax=Tanacetum cinerariifolium TaxID=118510 RepID=A0A699WS19_TANCI|nr:hypothetical protein [Tanacetum cinerariifolium]
MTVACMPRLLRRVYFSTVVPSGILPNAPCSAEQLQAASRWRQEESPRREGLHPGIRNTIRWYPLELIDL